MTCANYLEIGYQTVMGKEAQLEGLNLPPGIDAEKLLSAVIDSGYPLQTRAALAIANEFTVIEEWGFIDRMSDEHRALDLFAWRQLEPRATKLTPQLSLLMECKKSDLPVILFASAFQRVPQRFPVIAGFDRKFLQIRSGDRSRDVTPAEFFCLTDFPFVCDGPLLASSLARADRKGGGFAVTGDYPYRQLVLPLTSALNYFVDSRRPQRGTEWLSPTVVLCVAVVDAPLVVATGTSEEPILESTLWARVTRQEAAPATERWEPARNYLIDVVQIGFLQEYIAAHVLPFVEGVASRMASQPEITLAGLAEVPSLIAWSWDDLER